MEDSKVSPFPLVESSIMRFIEQRYNIGDRADEKANNNKKKYTICIIT